MVGSIFCKKQIKKIQIDIKGKRSGSEIVIIQHQEPSSDAFAHLIGY